ncbi:hypothetical protein, partial [Vibrio parahaemolyticus]|uniref:hypothetical protein n=1 Tax=Vibrio parahaemolyticus TaxID=670 RepID=UPI002111F19B
KISECCGGVCGGFVGLLWLLFFFCHIWDCFGFFDRFFFKFVFSSFFFQIILSKFFLFYGLFSLFLLLFLFCHFLDFIWFFSVI